MIEITQKLELLKNLDKEFSIFGSNAHKYELNPPLSKIELRAIEKEYGCTFPEEYKYFITNIGNGGAGPYYGIFPITMQDDGWELSGWKGGYLVGDLSIPFKFREKWNLPSEYWENEPNPEEGTHEEVEDKLWEEWDKKLENDYWNTSIMNGAIPICHEGCALRDWLVVTGDQAGSIWGDYRADNDGLEPKKNQNGKIMNFMEWYMSWLNESIQKIRGA